MSASSSLLRNSNMGDQLINCELALQSRGRRHPLRGGVRTNASSYFSVRDTTISESVIDRLLWKVRNLAKNNGGLAVLERLIHSRRPNLTAPSSPRKSGKHCAIEAEDDKEAHNGSRDRRQRKAMEMKRALSGLREGILSHCNALNSCARAPGESSSTDLNAVLLLMGDSLVDIENAEQAENWARSFSANLAELLCEEEDMASQSPIARSASESRSNHARSFVGEASQESIHLLKIPHASGSTRRTSTTSESEATPSPFPSFQSSRAEMMHKCAHWETQILARRSSL
ncbi:hypothetical protein V8E53_009710 [Lactarius tabidus]